MARQPEDAHGAEFTSSGRDELHRDSFVPVNTAVSVSKIVAESRQSPKLLDRVRALIRAKHYSLQTERIYVSLIKRRAVLGCPKAAVCQRQVMAGQRRPP
jgi:hypothetical protein